MIRRLRSYSRADAPPTLLHMQRGMRILLALLLTGTLAVACAPPGGEEEVAGGDPGAGNTEAPEDDASGEPAEDASVSGDAIKVGFLAATTGTAES